MNKRFNDTRIYLKDSDKARLANCRARIVREGGHVYGIIVEKWDEKQREWAHIDSIWGMHGAEQVQRQLNDEIDLLYDEVNGVNIPVCVDEEVMKYEFDNVESEVNEFV